MDYLNIIFFIKIVEKNKAFTDSMQPFLLLQFRNIAVSAASLSCTITGNG